jgi:hypothetical protein
MAQSTRLDGPFTDKTPRAAPANYGPVLTPEEARQGVISGRVMLVLAGSLILAALAGIIAYSAI